MAIKILFYYEDENPKPAINFTAKALALLMMRKKYFVNHSKAYDGKYRIRQFEKRGAKHQKKREFELQSRLEKNDKLTRNILFRYTRKRKKDLNTIRRLERRT
jgi:hypothetical protein